MKFGMIADVHGNLDALEAVLREMEARKVDKVIFLGDAVGYGAQPNEVCDLLRKHCDVALVGNHDAACCGKLNLEWFVAHARAAVEYTKQLLTDENMQWLKDMPYTWDYGEYAFSHGVPVKPEDFDYLIHPLAATQTLNWLQMNGLRAVFVGHAHQYIYFADFPDMANLIDGFYESKINLVPTSLYAINVGSVGQPRDGRTETGFGVLTPEESTYEVVRIPYDIKSAAGKIIDAGLPEILSQRLFIGR